MSSTRKCLDRKNFMNKLEQVKFDLQGELVKCSLGQTVKKSDANHTHKSKEKTLKIAPERSCSMREPTSSKNNRTAKIQLDRSKESKESRESLLKSTQTYYIAKRKGKRTGSTADKRLRGSKSKELNYSSNFINSTFEMQSFISTHKKKQSNFSSTVGSKFDGAHLNKSALEGDTMKEMDRLGSLLLKS